ncbi:MAG: aspartate carbamoyltransferase regulatory subunit [Lachnospiraceae bacterium]|nr:aspartate carbamoyltransferase regulatory subunit [Lachnospiraceae bacterium]
MLNVGQLNNGVVLDHIQAGKAMEIYHHLGLGKMDNVVAIIKNVTSKKMGKKDIIKIETSLDNLDLDILGFIDDKITVNIVKDGEIVEKKILTLPKKLTNVLQCKNPRCITSIEQELDHVFTLTDETKRIYRCLYCEEKQG